MTRSSRNRETYIDVFRGLMALVMVQGHVCEALLSRTVTTGLLYQLQLLFHGTTAPGFLFASGFVAGLPRAPLSARAALRRARRLLFVFCVGYFLQLPYFSLWKTIEATPAERLALFACNALQVISVTQIFVLALQIVTRRAWVGVAAALLAGALATGPVVWALGVSHGLPPALGAYLDRSSGSIFPLFPFAAFVLGGAIAGARIGHLEPSKRHRAMVGTGLACVGAGIVLAIVLRSVVDFWGVSPGYALVRLGALLLLMRGVEALSRGNGPLTRGLALFGHETLLVYVFHLLALYGGVLGEGLLSPWAGRLGFPGALLVLVLMVPALLAFAAFWRRTKARFPHVADLILVFVTVAFVWDFATCPW